MKIAIFIFFITAISLHQLFTCPSCVGRIRPESPPFFSTEFYKPGTQISRETKEQYGNQEFKKLVDSTRRKK